MLPERCCGRARNGALTRSHQAVEGSFSTACADRNSDELSPVKPRDFHVFMVVTHHHVFPQSKHPAQIRTVAAPTSNLPAPEKLQTGNLQSDCGARGSRADLRAVLPLPTQTGTPVRFGTWDFSGAGKLVLGASPFLRSRDIPGPTASPKTGEKPHIFPLP